MAYIRI